MMGIKEPVYRKTTYVHINGQRDRLISDGTGTRFSVPLSKIIENNSYSAKYYKIRLADIQIPNSAYTFGIEQSFLFFEEYQSGVNPNTENNATKTEFFIRIDTARIFVDGASLVAHLNQKLTDAGKPLQFTFNAQDGKLTLVNLSTTQYFRLIASYRYEDRFDIIFNDANDKLGFTQDTRKVYIAPNSSLKALSLINLIRSNFYYIICENLSFQENNNNIPREDSQGNNNLQILARISSQNFGQISQFFYPNNLNFKITENTVNRFTFDIKDQDFYSVDLNFSAVTMCLEIEHYY